MRWRTDGGGGSGRKWHSQSSHTVWALWRHTHCLQISPFSSHQACHCTTYYTPVLTSKGQTSYHNCPWQKTTTESSGTPHHGQSVWSFWVSYLLCIINSASASVFLSLSFSVSLSLSLTLSPCVCVCRGVSLDCQCESIENHLGGWRRLDYEISELMNDLVPWWIPSMMTFIERW